ncbi:ABC transporter substrate-binding protein, partial [Enterococcus faecium]
PKEFDTRFLEETQAFVSKYYTDDPENWGLMEEKVWRNNTAFMQENGLIKQDVPSQELFTNQVIK